MNKQKRIPKDDQILLARVMMISVSMDHGQSLPQDLIDTRQV